MMRLVALLVLLWSVPAGADMTIVVRRRAGGASTTTTTTSSTTDPSATTSTSTTTTTVTTTTLIGNFLFAPTTEFPSYVSSASHPGGVANAMHCARWTPSRSITGASRLAIATLAWSATNYLGLAFYSETGTTQIVTNGGVSISSGTSGVVTFSSLTPATFDLTAGTSYLTCWCNSVASAARSLQSLDTLQSTFAGTVGQQAVAFSAHGFSRTGSGFPSSADCTGNAVPPSSVGTPTAHNGSFVVYPPVILISQ